MTQRRGIKTAPKNKIIRVSISISENEYKRMETYRKKNHSTLAMTTMVKELLFKKIN